MPVLVRAAPQARLRRDAREIIAAGVLVPGAKADFDYLGLDEVISFLRTVVRTRI